MSDVHYFFIFFFNTDNPPVKPLETQSLKECRQRGQSYNESRELVMRWMQLATFLPVIRYARLPSDCDPQVLQLTKNLTSLRQQIVSFHYIYSNKTIVSSAIIYYRYNFYGIILNIYYSHKIYNGFSWRSNLLKMCYLCYIQFKSFLMVAKRSCKLFTILINARKSHACRFKILLFIFFFNANNIINYYEI